MREYTSIVIPTFNKAPLLRDILCDLNNQTDKEFEVVVVDDGSTDDTIDMLREVPVKYRLRVFETGLSDEFGMCKAYNIGIAHAFGALTLLLNDDVYLHPNCVKMHRIAHKKLRARHALIGPRFKCPPFAFGEEVECGDIKRRQFKKYTTARQIQGYPVYRVKMMVSSNLSMSTRRLRKIGGYNEIFKTYTGEIDRDFHRRVSSARMEVLYVWRAQAFSVRYWNGLYKQTKWLQEDDFRNGKKVVEWKQEQTSKAKKQHLVKMARQSPIEELSKGVLEPVIDRERG